MGRKLISWGVDRAAADAADVILDDCAACDIGLLVSDTGFEFKRTHERNDASAMSEMLMVNCRAPMQLTRGLITRLAERERSGIILTASIEALLDGPYSFIMFKADQIASG